MSQFYATQNNWKTGLYFLIRVGLGLYLLIHSVINLINYDDFIQLSRQYVPEGSSLGFLANLTPVVPLMEFFLAIMIIIGLYTRVSMIWALILGVFFTLLFHYVGDLETALKHAYTVVLKVGLFYSLYYNKFSADYYNIWSTAQLSEAELKAKREREEKKKVRESLQGL